MYRILMLAVRHPLLCVALVKPHEDYAIGEGTSRWPKIPHYRFRDEEPDDICLAPVSWYSNPVPLRLLLLSSDWPTLNSLNKRKQQNK